jgi:hypothetical protein
MKETIQTILEKLQEVTELLEAEVEVKSDSTQPPDPSQQPTNGKVYTVGLRSAYPKERTHKGLDWEAEWRAKGLLYDEYPLANKAKSGALAFLQAFAIATRLLRESGHSDFDPLYHDAGYPLYVPFLRFNGEGTEIVVKERTSTFAPFSFVFPTEAIARRFAEEMREVLGYR